MKTQGQRQSVAMWLRVPRSLPLSGLWLHAVLRLCVLLPPPLSRAVRVRAPQWRNGLACLSLAMWVLPPRAVSRCALWLRRASFVLPGSAFAVRACRV